MWRRKNESLSAIYSEGSFTWTNTHTRTQNDLIGFNAGSQNKINVKKFCTSFFYVSFAIKRTKSSEFSFVLFDNKKLYGETKIMLSWHISIFLCAWAQQQEQSRNVTKEKNIFSHLMMIMIEAAAASQKFCSVLSFYLDQINSIGLSAYPQICQCTATRKTKVTQLLPFRPSKDNISQNNH